MFNNLGTRDRLIRLVLASGLFYAGLYPFAHSGLGIGLDLVGAVLALTGIFGSCALYGFFGINTREAN
jgi:hypothetical protein